MDITQLTSQPLAVFTQPDLSSLRFGIPQRSGTMTVLPVFGHDNSESERYSAPLSGLKLSQVRGYGNVELANPSAEGVAIVPLHIGYIQDQAQNHALCRSAFLGAGQKLMFNDACCVQESQGGYMEEQNQWFFILPLSLRYKALQLRGKKGYSKLWDAISKLNKRFDYPSRGHLEQIVGRQRPYLTQYRSRFERLPGQTGALFFLKDKLVGIELTPSAAYFAELWMPLVCFCYGTEAMYEEQEREPDDDPTPYLVNNLDELRAQINLERQQLQNNIHQIMAQTPTEQFQPEEEEAYISLRLYTVDGTNFAGQFVQDKGNLIYASLFAKPSYLGIEG